MLYLDVSSKTDCSGRFHGIALQPTRGNDYQAVGQELTSCAYCGCSAVEEEQGFLDLWNTERYWSVEEVANITGRHVRSRGEHSAC